MITKKKLGRICKKCQKRFVPTGKYQQCCEKCRNELRKYVTRK